MALSQKVTKHQTCFEYVHRGATFIETTEIELFRQVTEPFFAVRANTLFQNKYLKTLLQFIKIAKKLYEMANPQKAVRLRF